MFVVIFWGTNKVHARTDLDQEHLDNTVVTDTLLEQPPTIWYSTIAALTFNGRSAADYVDIMVGDDGRLLVPFADIIRMGEAEVHRHAESVWEFRVPSLGAVLWVDAENKRVRTNGEEQPLADDAVEVMFDTLLIDKQLLEETFGLTIYFNELGMLMNVATTRPWPLDLRIAREMRWRRLGVQVPNGPPPVVYDMPYLATGAPQVNVEAGYNDSKNGSSLDNWRMQGVSEALYLTNRFSLSGNIAGGISSARLTSGRRDPRGNVLGIKSLYEATMGDVSGFSVPLARGAGSGIGFVLRGTPLTVPDNFDETIVTGEAPLGWDAELYISGQLYDFQQVDNNGQYRFEGIPLDFGINAIVVRLYSPSGDIETIDHSQRVGSRLAVGEVQWQSHVAKPERQLFDFHDVQRAKPDAYVSSFRGEIGVTKNLSAGVTYARVAELDAEQHTHTGNFLGVTVSPMLGDRAVNLSYSVQDNGMHAYAVRSSMPLGPLSVGLGYEYYDRHFGVLQGDTLSRVRQRYNVRTSIPLEFIGLKQQRIAVSHDETLFVAGGKDVRNQVSYGHRLLDLQVSHTANFSARYNNGNSSASRTGEYRLLSSYSRDLFSVRGELNYSLQPSTQFRNASVSGTYRINDFQTAAAGSSFSKGGSTSYFLSYTHLFDTLNMGVSASYGQGNWNVGLSISTSFGYLPGYGMHRQPTLNLERGMALVAATERFGHAPATPLPRLQMVVNQRNHQNYSDNDGFLVVDELDTLYPAQLTVNRSSLPDPFLVPIFPKVEIWPRPGQSIRLPVELVESSAVSGTAYIDFGEGRRAPLRRMFVELLDSAGRVHAETLTMDDGFYEFDSAYPANWFVRMQPEQSQLRAPITADAISFSIPEGVFDVNNIDLRFAVAPEEEPMVIVPREEQFQRTIGAENDEN